MKELQKYLNSIDGIFERAFVNTRLELILEPKHNLYFRLEDVKTELDFKCKMLEWVSRSCVKGVSTYYQRYFTDRLRTYFKYHFNACELKTIYTYLGNGTDRELCIKYIESNFDIRILIKGE